MSDKPYEDQRSIIALHKAINDFNAGVFLTEIPAALEAKVAEYKGEQEKGTVLGETISDLQEKGDVLDLSELADPSIHVRAWKRPVQSWDINEKVEALGVYFASNKLYQQINNGYHGVHENRSVWDFVGSKDRYVPLSKGYTTENLIDTFKEYGIDMAQLDHRNNFMLTDLTDYKIKHNMISHEEMLELRKQERYVGLKKLPEDVGIDFPEFDFEWVDKVLTIKSDAYDRLTHDQNIFSPEEERVSDSEIVRRVNNALKIELEKRKQLQEALMQRDEDIAAGKVDLEALAAEEAEKEARAEADKDEDNDKEDPSDDKDEPENIDDGLTDEERAQDLAEIERGKKDYSAENAALAPCNRPDYGKTVKTPRDENDLEDDPEDKEKDKDKETQELSSAKKPNGGSNYKGGEIPSKAEADQQLPNANVVSQQPMQAPVYDPLYGITQGVKSLFGFGNKPVNQFTQEAQHQPMSSMTEMAFDMKSLANDMKTQSGDELQSSIDKMKRVQEQMVESARYKFNKPDSLAAQKDIKNSKEVMKMVNESLKEVANNKDATDEQKRDADKLREGIEEFLRAIEDFFKIIASKFSRDNSPSPT